MGREKERCGIRKRKVVGQKSGEAKKKWQAEKIKVRTGICGHGECIRKAQTCYLRGRDEQKENWGEKVVIKKCRVGK